MYFPFIFAQLYEQDQKETQNRPMETTHLCTEAKQTLNIKSTNKLLDGNNKCKKNVKLKFSQTKRMCMIKGETSFVQSLYSKGFKNGKISQLDKYSS